jgi:cysteinyl-tRNA synthetase
MRLYSTLTRDLVELPEPPGPIGMYVCGPTVYARAHIGNARPFVLACWYKRWLRERGYDVTLVHNITDVNDKIYEAAPGASAERARQATEWYLEDTGRFGLDEVDLWPKVTETMDEIVAFIADLIERGFAYEVDGDVYFRVARWAEYGRLSGQKPDQVEEQEPNARKEDPRDFALWKANKPGEDTSWSSPWGEGRPGWHIECSAMAEKLLGPVFEIHGGGLDLVFPHHENELAQSRARGNEFAKIWMHNGMLRPVGHAKMSKSEGNFETIRDAVDRWGPETLVVFFLTAHWSKPIDYSDETVRAAEARKESLREVFRNPSESAAEGEWERFVAALEDDFNTPEALAIMHSWRDHDLLRRALDVFGLASLAEQEAAPPAVVDLATKRQDARASGDFAEADRLRGEIAELGWTVRDVAEGFQLVRTTRAA